MQKTFIITAECAESDGLYVICRENQLNGFLEECGYGCSECRNYQ